MKLPVFKKNSDRKPLNFKESFKTRTFLAGGYSVAAVVVVLAIAIAINIFAKALPASIMQYDTTSNQLFTISDQTEKILAGMQNDVTIYWIVQSDNEDETLGLLLDRYAALSNKISIVKRDPDVYPTFAQKYDITQVYNNSLVVESGERFRYVGADEIYEYEYGDDYYYTGSYSTSFAGESAVTSAINYVISEDLPKMYILTGHGESEIPSTFTEAVGKENIETESLSLLTLEAIPEDADMILINSPQSDIAEEEKEKILTYLKSGGNMMLISNPPENTVLTNLESLMAEYGVTANAGVVIEGDQNHYVWGMPYYLLPDVSSHTITAPLSENGYYVLLPIAQGLTVSDSLPDSVTVSELLTTSDSAFSKIAGYELQTYEKEDGDIDGGFALAVAITDTIDENTESQIVWVTSASLLDEQTNMRVSGGNQDFFLNALSWMGGQEDNISIHSKSLGYEYLTMNSSFASMFTVILIAIIPLAYLGIGLRIWIRRKRR